MASNLEMGTLIILSDLTGILYGPIDFLGFIDSIMDIISLSVTGSRYTELQTQFFKKRFGEVPSKGYDYQYVFQHSQKKLSNTLATDFGSFINSPF